MSIKNISDRERELAAQVDLLEKEKLFLLTEREALKCQRDRFHHLMQKHGLHPGRTDDDLLEILDVALAKRDALKALLAEAQYALDYASDMTKPEGMSGCDCPICTTLMKIDTAMKEQQA